MEEFAREEREEERIETAVRILKDGKMTETELMYYFHLSPEQMEKVKEQIAVFA